MKTALIMDDSEKVRVTLNKILTAMGFKVFEAGDGISGIKMIQEHDIDLLVLDLIMPKKGGVDTLLELRTARNLKIIVITGNVMPDNDQFMNFTKTFGIKHTLFKPFRRSDFINAVNDTFAKKSA